MYESNASGPGKSNWLGRAVVVVCVWGTIAAGGYYLLSLFIHGNAAPQAGKAAPMKDPGPAADAVAAGTARPAEKAVTELGLAYGTEKSRWLEFAVEQFGQSDEGKRIKIKLLPMGSLESAHAILDGDKRIHIWSPASSLYRGTFVQDWQLKHSGNPILKEEILALSPMVFVMWKDRYDAFQSKYAEVSFRTVGQALEAEGGWGGIAKKPEWGLFKFGHTHPNQSNSGLVSLILMAYDFNGKSKNLGLPDAVKPEFQTWLGQLERGVSGLSNSTAVLMRDMVLKGPSTFDAVLVYESVAIDFLANAEGRWGQLQVVYPKYNLWNDNPYYVLNNEWTTPAHQEAAETFLKFLMSEPIQKRALDHGFRPGNPAVPVKFPESPFVRYEKFGLRIDVPTICDLPSAEVINNLQQIWQRAQGPR